MGSSGGAVLYQEYLFSLRPGRGCGISVCHGFSLRLICVLVAAFDISFRKTCSETVGSEYGSSLQQHRRWEQSDSPF